MNTVRTLHRAGALRRQGALAVLGYVHAQRGATRSDAARALGLSSGSAADITARLKGMRLLGESDPPPTGSRGRPSPILTAHPDGPLACAVQIGHERWRIAVVELGGGIVERDAGRHPSRRAEAVLGDLEQRIAALSDRYGHRLRVVAVSIAATVQGEEVVQASTLRWRSVGLDRLRPTPATVLLVGNDASLAGLAEARRGAGRGARVVLHLTVEVGVGGVLVVDGVPMDGATGAGGEFGHLPFGEPGRACPCGATGCWDLEVDGRAMARNLGLPAPRNPRTKAEQVLAAAPRDAASRAAVRDAARALGRGIGGLVNATDPELVTLSGLAVGIAATAAADLHQSYREALMRFRRSDPPALEASVLEPDSQILGAADLAFDTILTPEGIDAWADT